jgi:pyruvate dehydrogenase (quinone)
VLELAELLAAPVAHTSRAKDWLEPDNPYDVGMTGLFGIRSGYEAVLNCDTLLLLGCDFAWRQFYPDNAKIIQIDIDAAHLGKRHPVDIGVVGDVGATLEALIPLIRQRDDDAFLSDMLALHTKSNEAQNRHAKVAAVPIHPQYLVETIAACASEDAVWTADGGSATVWCLRHVPATGLNRTVISLTHGTMANAMPQALGAQAAFPDRQVISLSGDGGLAMLMGDMLTAVQEELPIKVAVINNSSLGFVEIEMKVEGLIDHYTDLKNPDFGEVARSMGWWGRHVEAPQELAAAVDEWLAAPGPALLDVVTDRLELVMPPHVGVGQLYGTALYSAKAILSGEAGDVIGMAKNLIK